MIKKFPSKLNANVNYSNSAFAVIINILVDKINEIIDVINKGEKE